MARILLMLIATLLIGSNVYAQVPYVPCQVDPYQGQWPLLTYPAIVRGNIKDENGAVLSTYFRLLNSGPLREDRDEIIVSPEVVTEVQPFTQSTVISGSPNYPWQWSEINYRGALGRHVAINLMVLHLQGKVDYKQVFDTVNLVVAQQMRAGVLTGQYEVKSYPEATLPDGTVVPATIFEVPIYAEYRWSADKPFANPYANDRFGVITQLVRGFDRHLYLGWKSPWLNGVTYLSNMTKERYTGLGLAPEISSQIFELLLPLPRAGLCQIPQQ